MNRRKFIKAVGIGTATSALFGGNVVAQSEPVDKGGSGGSGGSPEVVDSDVGVNISPHPGVGDGGADGLTAHLDPNDNSRLMLSGATLLQNDHRYLEVYDWEVDEANNVIDLTLQFWKTDEANHNAARGVGARVGGGGGMSNGPDLRYKYKVYGYVEFDRDVSEYEFDV